MTLGLGFLQEFGVVATFRCQFWSLSLNSLVKQNSCGTKIFSHHDAIHHDIKQGQGLQRGYNTKKSSIGINSRHKCYIRTMEVSFDVGLPPAAEATSDRRDGGIGEHGHDSASSTQDVRWGDRAEEEDLLLAELLWHVRAERWDDLIQLLLESLPTSSSVLFLPVGLDHRGNVEVDDVHDEGDEQDSDSDAGSVPVNAVGSLLHVVCAYPLVPFEVIETMVKLGGPNLCRQTSTHSMRQTPLHVIVQQCPERCDLVELLVTTSPKIVNQRDVQYFLPIEVLCQTIIMKEERLKYTSNGQRRGQLSEELDSLWSCARILANAAASLSPSIMASLPLSDSSAMPESGISANLEQLQLDAPPEATSTVPHPSSQSDSERQPMIHSCLRAVNFPFALTERAMKRYPEQLSQADVYGDLPLHIVAGRTPPSMSTAASTTTATTAATSRFGQEEDDHDEHDHDEEGEESDNDDDDDEDDDDENAFLDQLISLYPQAASIWNRNGQIPLTVAINSGRRWNSGISRLLEAHPAGIEDQGLPLELYHLLYAQVVRHGHMSTLYGMLRAKPELFTRPSFTS